MPVADNNNAIRNNNKCEINICSFNNNTRNRAKH